MFLTISGGGRVMLSWKDLLVPIVGCHLASRFRNSGPRAERAQLILIQQRFIQSVDITEMSSLGHGNKQSLT